MPEGIGYPSGGTPADAFGMVGDMLEGLKGAVAESGGGDKALAIVDQMLQLKDELMAELGMGGEKIGGPVPATGGADMAQGNPGAVPVR